MFKSILGFTRKTLGKKKKSPPENIEGPTITDKLEIAANDIAFNEVTFNDIAVEADNDITFNKVTAESDMNELLQSWISIQNLVYFDKNTEYLTSISSMPIDKDICEYYTVARCNDPCKLYKKKKCVYNERIKTFTEGEFIEDKMYHKNYRIENIHTNTDGTITNYCALSYEKNLYILFNSGGIIKNLDEDPKTKYVVDNAINYIQKEYANYNNIILCGHSYGCVCALLCSLHFLKKTPQQFLKKMYTFGSAPFRWIHKKDKRFFTNKALDKIMIYGLINWYDETKMWCSGIDRFIYSIVSKNDYGPLFKEVGIGMSDSASSSASALSSLDESDSDEDDPKYYHLNMNFLFYEGIPSDLDKIKQTYIDNREDTYFKRATVLKMDMNGESNSQISPSIQLLRNKDPFTTNFVRQYGIVPNTSTTCQVFSHTWSIYFARLCSLYNLIPLAIVEGKKKQKNTRTRLRKKRSRKTIKIRHTL